MIPYQRDSRTKALDESEENRQVFRVMAVGEHKSCQRRPYSGKQASSARELQTSGQETFTQGENLMITMVANDLARICCTIQPSLSHLTGR